MTDKQKSRANMTVDQVNLDRCICDIDLVASGRKDCEEIRKHIRAIRRIFAGLPEEPTKFDVGDTIRPKGSKAEYTITSISGGCYHGKGWGIPISAEKDYELVESAEDVDAQINSQNEAIKQLNRALNSMEHGGHLPLVEDNMISDKYIYGKEPEIVDIDDLPLDACNIQYASIDGAIKAHAEDYSFNIESKLFQQLTPEQQEMWRKEIEQAVLSGAYSGLNLARDKRYEENRQEESVSEDLLKASMEFAKGFGEWHYAMPCFQAGAKWHKQQMVENAVEGKVDRFCDDDVVAVIYREPRDNDIRGLYIRSNGLQPGDKVKIIIVKEDKL